MVNLILWYWVLLKWIMVNWILLYWVMLKWIMVKGFLSLTLPKRLLIRRFQKANFTLHPKILKYLCNCHHNSLI
ncbi:hypothetical protein BpHYR1_028924 [Brachionus plicatilis]|uniref:Uncharacterized protein n=1 Tax=Brachionus plicatilis TaxID=10195 RepID=A0A3M7PKT2_BRAPC|nr:hypothetical protein BpHYR1_028924 [Brachionus plicatilis]